MFSRWMVRWSALIGLLLPLAAAALEAPPGEVLPADYQPWPREVKNGAITYLIH